MPFDVEPMKPTITQTYELGYKGTLFNKLLIGVDAYHTKIRDFVGPITPETPNVFLDPATLGAYLGRQFGAALDDPQNAILNGALIAMLDKNPAFGGNSNGSAADELATLFATGGAGIPFGTVTPEEANDPVAVTSTYRNFGDISLNGADFKFAYFLNENWNIGGNYSFVSEDLFENVDGLRDVALNAPKHKIGASVEYLNSGLSNLAAQLRVRFVDAFPVNSGVYHGTVERYTTIDLSAGYDLPFSPNTPLVTRGTEPPEQRAFRSSSACRRLGVCQSSASRRVSNWQFDRIALLTIRCLDCQIQSRDRLVKKPSFFAETRFLHFDFINLEQG